MSLTQEGESPRGGEIIVGTNAANKQGLFAQLRDAQVSESPYSSVTPRVDGKVADIAVSVASRARPRGCLVRLLAEEPTPEERRTHALQLLSGR